MIEISTAYKRHRFPARLIAYAVWLYFRFPLSLRLVEELLLERGIVVSYESIRRWAAKFGPAIARGIRRRAPRPGGIRPAGAALCGRGELGGLPLRLV